MNGIINVLKPPGMTSHDVVSFMRKTLNIKKIGHTGTLDPEAAGVLPICIGKATRVAQFLTDKRKRYRANIKFGKVTDTYDSYGSVIRDAGPVEIDSVKLEAVLQGFLGTITQRPPIYSALKVDGRKLYEYARAGQEVEIEERPVDIYQLKLIEMLGVDEAMIDILCSKGTYIRTLCYDIGEALGCGAYMSQLVRLESTPFTIETSHTLEEIKAAAGENRIEGMLENAGILFKDYKTIIIKSSALESVMNGNPVFEPGIKSGFESITENDDISVFSEEEFLGIGIALFDPVKERLYIKIKKIFV